MGLIKCDLRISSGHIYVWDQVESTLELETLLLSEGKLQQLDEAYLNIKLDSRRKHWLVSRLLLLYHFKENQQIIYDQYGAPHIADKNEHISISHSGNLLCLAVSKIQDIGVDIQQLSPKIATVSSKFLTRTESEIWMSCKNEGYIHYCWTIKEAVFKLFKSDLAFKKISILTPFPFASDLVEVQVLRGERRYNLIVRISKIGEYYLSCAKM